MKIKKYKKGGGIKNDPPKDRSKDIEALKAKYRDTKDPAVKQELDAAREEQKQYTAGQSMDALREGRASSAERSGDEARAQRIRSTKQTQGMGETGRDEKGSRKRFSKGGYVKYGK